LSGSIFTTTPFSDFAEELKVISINIMPKIFMEPSFVFNRGRATYY